MKQAITAQAKIAAFAHCWKGRSDRRWLSHGAKCSAGCVYTVNGIVHRATGMYLGGDASVNNVDPLRNDGDVAPIPQSESMPGDFMIVDSSDNQEGHIGICEDEGCTDVISNSSSYCTFTFDSPDNHRFGYPGSPGSPASPYNGGNATYWRAVLK
ncbi:MAG: hypothetical protein ACREM6_12425 [Vulcanimicrobiaceae bacterium]